MKDCEKSSHIIKTALYISRKTYSDAKISSEAVSSDGVSSTASSVVSSVGSVAVSSDACVSSSCVGWGEVVGCSFCAPACIS